MAQQTIGLGTTDNDGTGDTAKAAGAKINANFSELYAAVAAAAIKTAYEGNSDTNAYDDAAKEKVDYLTITQAVDLDTIEARVNALDAAVVLMGTWDASGGSFPSSTNAGESWIVSVGGTVDSVVFGVGDRIVAITDGASGSTYAANWLKLDYTDQVLSVAGKTGAVSLDADDVSETGSKFWAAESGAQANPSTVSQAEAEAGSATTARLWTAERVAQAIAALAAAGTFQYVGIEEKTSAYTILSGDAGKLITCSGTFTLTLPSSMTNVGQSFVDIENFGTGTITISAGTDGINTAGNDSFTIEQGEKVRLTYASASDPKWRAAIPDGISGTSAQMIVVDGSDEPAFVTISGNIAITNAGATRVTQITDANGNEVLTYSATASAVNHVGLTNVATGNDPTVGAVGDDTNIHLLLAGKGTGGVIPNMLGKKKGTMAISSGAVTYNIAANGDAAVLTLTENVTSMAFTNPIPSADGTGTLTLFLKQDGTGSRTIAWPASVVWPGGTAPTITATASGVDIYVFTTDDGGTTWYGNIVGQAYS